MMKPDKATVYEVFQLEKRYIVPLYQRPYVWKLEEHWAPLWDDIEAKAASLAMGEAAQAHFLGAIVLSQVKVGLRQIAASQVIDGQQRLTTLQVLLAAFRDVVGELTAKAPEGGVAETEAGKIFKMLAQITEHPNVLGADEDRYKVWPTNADRSQYQVVMSAKSRTAIDAKFPIQFTGKRKKTAVPGPRLVEAYRFFDARIRAFLGADPANRGFGEKDALLGLFEAVRRSLQLVVIDLDEDDDPQVIFETLNARGEALLPSDLIRNLVFTRAGKDGDALYESHWHQYDANQADGTPGFWKTKVKQGREVRPVLDLFFHSYLSCRSERVIPLGHLFDEFRRWWESQKTRTARELLEEVRRFSDAYRAFQEPERFKANDQRLATFVRRLRVLDTAMVYPALLFLVVEAEGRIQPTERDGMLVDLESFLVRRWICNVTTKNYNRLFIALLQRLREVKTLDRHTFRAHLAQWKGVDGWPEDKEFETAWLRDSAYGKLGSPGIQMVLGAIHETLLSSKQEKILLPSGLTVEHVMPQAWRNHWPSPPEVEVGSAQDENAAERRDRIIHTFGNLTLLTQALNSDVRDGAYEKKRPEITKQSLLLLNTYFQDATTWDETAILQRGQKLLDHAKKIWPSPPTPAPPAGSA
jgi:hypothetical protein